MSLNSNYDALVSDGRDNILVAITGQNGDGVAVIDLWSLTEPPPLPYASTASVHRARATTALQTKHRTATKPVDRNSLGTTPRLPHLLVPPRL